MVLVALSAGKIAGNSAELDAVEALTVTRSPAMARKSSVALNDVPHAAAVLTSELVRGSLDSSFKSLKYQLAIDRDDVATGSVNGISSGQEPVCVLVFSLVAVMSRPGTAWEVWTPSTDAVTAT